MSRTGGFVKAAWILACAGAVLAAGCRDAESGDSLMGRVARHAPDLPPGRLSGPFRPADCREAGDEGCPPPAPGTRGFEAFSEASRTLRTELSGAESPEALHQLGVLELLWTRYTGDAPDRAIGMLLDAHVGSPGDAAILTDLAAAYLARFHSGGAAADVVQALDFAEWATEADSSQAAAAFNRTTALSELGLDSRRPDEPEAGSEDLGRVRDEIMDRLLPTWASGGPGADSALDRAALLARDHPDRSLAVLVREAAEAEDPDEATSLRSGLAAFGRGRRLYETMDQADFDGAAREFAVAARHLAGSGPGRPWAEVWQAASYAAGARYEEAENLTRRLLDEIDGPDHPALRGLTHRVSAVVHGRAGRQGRSLPHLEAAVADFGRAGERRNAALARSHLAETRKVLGSPREAWDDRIEALRALGTSGDDRVQGVLVEASEAAERDGLRRVSALFLDRAVGNAIELQDPWRLVEAYARRGRSRVDEGDLEGARADVEEARRHLPSIPPGSLRDWAAADVHWLEGRLAGASSHERPYRAFLDSARIGFQSLGNDVHGVAVLLDAARIAAGRGEPGAEADIRAALDLLERGGQGSLGLTDRVLLANTVRNQTLDALPWSGAPDPAFLIEATERAAALAWGASPDAGLWDPDGVIELAPGTTLVRYVVLDDGILVSAVSAEGRVSEFVGVDRGDLQSAVRATVRGAQQAETLDDVEAERSRLGALLLPPAIQAALGDEVVFVPDGALASAPFSLLPGRTADLLIRERTLRILPAASLALDERGSGPRSGPESRGVVVISDPAAADTIQHPRLRWARSEADSIAATWPRVRSLSGPAATASAFVEAASGASILHYAGHAVSVPSVPAGSHLVLAPDEGTPTGMLYAHELADAEFTAPELVILTACGSVAPETLTGGGFWGVAMPFLDRGSRGVIGAIWPVSDAGAARFSTTLHGGLVAELTPAEAVRQAQLRAVDEGGVALRDWAAFQVVGG